MNTLIITYLGILGINKILRTVYKLEVMRLLANRGYKFRNCFNFNRMTVNDLNPFNIKEPVKMLAATNMDEAIEKIIREEDLLKISHEDRLTYLQNGANVLEAYILNVSTKEPTTGHSSEFSTKSNNYLRIDATNLITYQVNIFDPKNKYRIISTQGGLVTKLKEDEKKTLIDEYNKYVSDAIDEYISENYDGNEALFYDELLENSSNFQEFRANIDADFGGRVLSRLKK